MGRDIRSTSRHRSAFDAATVADGDEGRDGAEAAALWTFADVWETVARTTPAAAAEVHVGRRTTWQAFDRRADGFALALLEAGLRFQDKMALYLYNCPEYMEASFGALKAAFVPVNTNYRYTGEELLYLWTNADAAAVVFHGAFTERIEAVRSRCPRVKIWVHVEDGTAACPGWAVRYEDCVQRAGLVGAAVRAPWGRSGEDQIMIYTGGTTGLPRGVVWRQHDLYLASNTSNDPETADAAHVRARLRAEPPVGLPAAPLMHGTGFVFAATILNRGGTVVTLAERRFDAAHLLDVVQAERVTDLCIVGDAFCLPIVEALEEAPGRWDLSRLRVVSSSGMVWSAGIKQRLLAQAPDVLLIDFLNASEASGMGRSLASSRHAGEGTRFRLGDNAFVIDAGGAMLPPGSDAVGRLAVRGHVPLGYYKDPERSAATFPTIGGVRCAVPGDYARIEADGSIMLLGRGSTCINTGGEKVFAEEIEAAIKTFPGARDAVVVGLPDLRFGQMVAAVVEIADAAVFDRAGLMAHLRANLAGPKLPRVIMPADTIGRAPNGKIDHRQTIERIQQWLATLTLED